MATKHARLTRIVLLVVLPATISLIVVGPNAHADNSVPTATAVSSPPEATEAPLPPPTALPTAESAPTVEPAPPTAAEEESAPIATTPPAMIQEPAQAPTLAPVTERVRRPVRREVTPPTPTSVVVPAITAPPSEPLPSPADLQMNARLRWGTHIPPQVRRWAFLIVPAARKYHLDPNLLAAIMTMESNGDPLALSSADARGLMQILHGPWDPRKNVTTGARMMARLLAQFGSVTLALAAYNAGPDAVLGYNGVPPYRETRDYVIIVQYLYDLYSHHRLTVHRKSQYRRTLKDLQRFADQRKKIQALARVAHLIPDRTRDCRQYSAACRQQALAELSNGGQSRPAGSSQPAALFPTLDPFWPVGGAPDPLQRVDPIVDRGG